MTTESPFTIGIPDTDLEFLRKKLGLTRFPDELEESGGEYGAPLADVQRLAKHWQDVYLPQWRQHEAKLNQDLPQFTRDIEVEGFGVLNIHYVHKKSEVADAIPLLFVHGWPGSFIEVRKILPLLIQASPDHPSFHVVALSLPGYGFSDSPKKAGFAMDQYAEVCNKLMLGLGYNEYVTQGGDWGSMITRRIAQLYGGTHSKAWHTNFPMGTPPSLKRPLSILAHFLLGYSPKEKAGIERMKWYQDQGFGYFKQQSTKPQTLGYSLADSPVGLLGWIYEKLVVWTDDYPWTDDEVLTWISIYWFSKAGPTASTRIYFEFVKQGPVAFFSSPAPPIPTGHSYFPKDVIIMPRRWISVPNLVLGSEHDKGGHFVSWEVPEVLVADLRQMFRKGSKAYGVVPGKTGYQEN